jgi:hypothetical protein
VPVHACLLLWLQTEPLLHDVCNLASPIIGFRLDVHVVQGRWCHRVESLLLGLIPC